MSKIQTAWNSSSKSTHTWTPVVRTSSAWVTSDTHVAAVFTPVVKNTDSWSNESVVQTPYTYDSPNVKYDNVYAYDYKVPVANQSNSKQPTAWANV
jgi:hypothetical protein